MGTLIPNEPLIYETKNGQVFARYKNPPYNKIKPWWIGGTVNNANTEDEDLWIGIKKASETNKALQNVLKEAILLYQLSREDYGKEQIR